MSNRPSPLRAALRAFCAIAVVFGIILMIYAGNVRDGATAAAAAEVGVSLVVMFGIFFGLLFVERLF